MSIEKEFIDHLEENIQKYATYIKQCRSPVKDDNFGNEEYVHIARTHLYSILKFSIAEYLSEVFYNLPDTICDDGEVYNEYCDDQCSPSSSDSEQFNDCSCFSICKCKLFDSESSDSDY